MIDRKINHSLDRSIDFDQRSIRENFMRLVIGLTRSILSILSNLLDPIMDRRSIIQNRKRIICAFEGKKKDRMEAHQEND